MIHNISYRTFVYGTEDEEKVITAISYLFSNSLPEKSINEDHFGNKIIVLTDKITKKRTNKDIIAFLNENLSEEDKNTIKNELNRRMDDKGNLFLRFDKQLAFDEKLKLTYSGNAIHIRIKIASYPVSKENAIEVAKKLFNFL
ncbi:RNA-binding domain-containing protein [Methanosphaera sp.]|uniref:RNA-binding domain-containing protein n=1 Tax=Methanosphaera sp. TaxID=2666342 RepID=UPI0025CFAECA|nr:RNA-binding domain-containing protein [Methanosphaera sp.]MEE1117958.1 RNA-binding domain-containing protein [Methanosphaera sp.]MEE3324532.1 RNA-binding domain-containing protein [Methanosphaera sp.]MEE3418598.1 RNA-binding domain-containing protein [Methanosphaera sp.]